VEWRVVRLGIQLENLVSTLKEKQIRRETMLIKKQERMKSIKRKQISERKLEMKRSVKRKKAWEKSFKKFYSIEKGYTQHSTYLFPLMQLLPAYRFSTVLYTIYSYILYMNI
jgi:hypothetical protein